MTRRERLERRAEKREEWARSREARSAASFESARTIMDGIPPGQPVLVGHHSERHHRRDLARIDARMSAGVESAKMAERHADASSEIRHQLDRSIYSDDADALERLRERIADLEAERERIKTYNALRRKRKSDAEGIEEDARAAGLTDSELAGLLSTIRVAAWQCRFASFPPYHLQNLGGNITRNRQRLDQLTREQTIRDSGGRGRGRPMISRYGGTCADCGAAIDRGAPIVWFRIAKEAVHADCNA